MNCGVFFCAYYKSTSFSVVVVLICKVLQHHHYTHTHIYINVYMYALRSRQGKTFECVMCLRRGLPQQGMLLSFSPTFTYMLFFHFLFLIFLIILEGEGGSEIRAKRNGKKGKGVSPRPAICLSVSFCAVDAREKAVNRRHSGS